MVTIRICSINLTQLCTTNMAIFVANDPNLLTVSWATGSGGTGIFSQNGSTSENERVNDTNPHGQTAVVWETRPTATNDADGGWNTSYFNIDNTKLYRFSVWARRTTATSGGTFYMGMYDNVIVNELLTDSTEGNPYWECTGTGNMTQNVWYLFVGHVFPASTKHRTNHPETGRYIAGGGRSSRTDVNFCNIAGDLRWNASATQAIHRVYHYYCADNTTRLQFWGPRVDLVDGSEPSIEDLLNNNFVRPISSRSNRKIILDGSTPERAAPDPSYLQKNGLGQSGMYFLNPGGLGVNKFYIEFNYYSNKPFVMVLSNRRGNGGIDYATYARCTGPWVNVSSGTYDDNLNFNLWVGLDYWRYLGDTIIHGVKGLQQTYVAGTHNTRLVGMDKIARFQFAGWTSTYAFKYPRDYTNLAGSTTSGWYSYHVSNGFSLSTYDQDQDTSGGNCSASYDNNPWWYGACWDGNFFAGGGHVDAPYWSGSSSDYYAYGAAYIGWFNADFDVSQQYAGYGF